jgi:acyl-CoA reductase-like NAD-dependent aldehyde dehydrogenase
VSAQGGVLQTREPATGDVLAEVGLANKGDVTEAAKRARGAQPEWAANPVRPGGRARGSRDLGRAVADQLTTGIVHVNDQTLNNDAYAPFGGTGGSGNGSRFGSQSSWDEFTQWQWLTLRDQAHGFPF